MPGEYDELIPYYEDLRDDIPPEIINEEFLDNVSFLDINEEYTQ